MSLGERREKRLCLASAEARRYQLAQDAAASSRPGNPRWLVRAAGSQGEHGSPPAHAKAEEAAQEKFWGLPPAAIDGRQDQSFQLDRVASPAWVRWGWEGAGLPVTRGWEAPAPRLAPARGPQLPDVRDPQEEARHLERRERRAGALRWAVPEHQELPPGAAWRSARRPGENPGGRACRGHAWLVPAQRAALYSGPLAARNFAE